MSKLEAVSITKSFGDNTILQDVSLRLEPREIVCLLGVSGGGKTTLFNVLSGLTLPDRGRYSGRPGDHRQSRAHQLYAAKGPADALPHGLGQHRPPFDHQRSS